MKIFITGAAGYIGGSVAARFIEEGYQVRGLVRTAEQAERVRALGIVPVIGTLEDSDIMVREANAADAVVNAASSDHRPAVEALLEGLRGSNKPFIHTSGSSVVGDDARGEWKSDKVYAEDTPVDVVPERRRAPRSTS